MAVMRDVLDAVEAAFREAARGLDPWPDPRAGRPAAPDAYSRLTDPERYRIVGARADAWRSALVGLGLADVGTSTVRWTTPPRTVLTGAETVVPRAPGALPLILARSAIGPIPDAGVTLGVGDPATCIAWFPDCGCDACDTGSQDLLDDLDAHLAAIVEGRFRRLSRRGATIMSLGDGGWSASGIAARGGAVERILARPDGWDELCGATWLAPA